MLETKAGSGMECAGAGACEGKAAAPCRIVVMVSGGGTNLQAIIDRVKDGSITNTVIAGVISNNRNAYSARRRTGSPQNVSPQKIMSPERSLMKNCWRQ